MTPEVVKEKKRMRREKKGLVSHLVLLLAKYITFRILYIFAEIQTLYS